MDAGGLDILKRSTLPTSPYYDPLFAVSELDFVSTFNDFSPCQIANSEVHRPMGIEVHHETYQWNFAEFQNIMFVHLKVTNHGPLLKNVWVGFYTEFAAAARSATRTGRRARATPAAWAASSPRSGSPSTTRCRSCASTTAAVRAAPRPTR